MGGVKGLLPSHDVIALPRKKSSRTNSAQQSGIFYQRIPGLSARAFRQTAIKVVDGRVDVISEGH
jgi:hypothetical protein